MSKIVECSERIEEAGIIHAGIKTDLRKNVTIKKTNHNAVFLCAQVVTFPLRGSKLICKSIENEPLITVLAIYMCTYFNVIYARGSANVKAASKDTLRFTKIRTEQHLLVIHIRYARYVGVFSKILSGLKTHIRRHYILRSGNKR